MNWEDILKEQDLSHLNDASKKVVLLANELLDEIEETSKSKIAEIIYEFNMIQAEGTEDLYDDMPKLFAKLVESSDNLKYYAAMLSKGDFTDR
tara:strand:- start:268 stop:546 length:279 start_codon:yes stop_codon:yes gene_type:complete